MTLSVCCTDQQKCMLRRDCPDVKVFLENQIDDDVDDISYRQWISTDSTVLKTLTEDQNEFIDSLAEQVYRLTKHHFVAKLQSAYLSTLKENLLPSEVIPTAAGFLRKLYICYSRRSPVFILVAITGYCPSVLFILQRRRPAKTSKYLYHFRLS